MGCTHRELLEQNGALQKEVLELKQVVEKLKPDLGEIMVGIHLHHAKVYFSGMAQNWPLAAYELDEIKEGLDQATELHDHFKDLKVSLKELKHFTDQGLQDLGTAIQNQNKPQFLLAFQRLTQSCNHCHVAGRNARPRPKPIKKLIPAEPAPNFLEFRIRSS